ncbi:aquaporin Z [Solirubrobacter sp. CPCC 204708]|uniref:Aquaporin Z n=1 Tax=Solirubrobacter deserti TaxID=2282478 RepID=A0ABT4RUI9_9ACTN|nr:aquaporin Z [Solirubrobacter deserti]MBE2317281.1 aquaporin Z [Solirubrobacter deserti]MDA0142048.1 aquaporin Z [Solirubrobacter deserti]
MHPRRITAAEFVGTFVLVFGGVGSAVIAGEVIGALGVAFAFGLSLLAMAYAIGPISGCHINPAVTIGLAVSRRITWRETVGYFVGQVLGAVAAALLLLIIVKAPDSAYDLSEQGFGANGFGDHSPSNYPLLAALLAEIVLTGLLVFTVLSATDRMANVAFAGIPIGLVLTLIHLVGIPIDNTSVNPARSLGPAVFVGGWALEQLWLFIVAPIVGAVGGALLHGYLFTGAAPVDPEASAVAAEPPLATT